MPQNSEQKALLNAVYQHDNSDLTPLIKDNGINKDKRIEVYKNNVNVNLQNTLKRVYPAILALVGEEFFIFCANEYIKKHQPTSGNLDEYGEFFSQFLKNFSHAISLPYLCDLAQLEWALHLAYFAADKDPIAPNEFNKTPPEKLETVKFTAHPSLFLLKSDYPINKIYEFAKKGGTDELNINSGGEFIAVIRPEYKVNQVTLSKSEYYFLKSVCNGNNLFKSYEVAFKEDESFELNIMLIKSINNGFFTDFKHD